MAKDRGFKYVLKPGFMWNPLKGYPRNQDCFCGSLLKHKICCIDKVHDVVTTEQHHQVKLALKQGRKIKLTTHETEETANQVETDNGTESTTTVESSEI